MPLHVAILGINTRFTLGAGELTAGCYTTVTSDIATSSAECKMITKQHSTEFKLFQLVMLYGMTECIQF